MRVFYPEDCFRTPVDERAWTLFKLAYYELSWLARMRKASELISWNPSNFQKTVSYLGESNVARKPRSNSGRSAESVQNGAGRVDWCNVSLSDDDALELQERFSDAEVCVAQFIALSYVARNVFVKFDPVSNSFCAGFIITDGANGDRLVGLSGWSDDPIDAIRSFLYKWFVLLEQTIPATISVGGTKNKFR